MSAALAAMLRSRKVLLALVAVATSIGMQFGYDIDPQVTQVLVGAVIAVVIGGIAHEDAAAKSKVTNTTVAIADQAPKVPPAPPAESDTP